MQCLVLWRQWRLLVDRALSGTADGCYRLQVGGESLSEAVAGRVSNVRARLHSRHLMCHVRFCVDLEGCPSRCGIERPA